MDEHEIAIPFDVGAIHENSLRRLLRKVNTGIKSAFKRVFEIIVSIIGLIMLIPLTLVVIFQNLKNNDEGPIFYTQERVGKNGKTFKMYKFRTMVKNADEILEAMLQNDEIRAEYEKYRKFRHDPRLTTFGKVLRAKSLDEFPQFINVLKGELSIIGPRAYMVTEKSEMGDAYKTIIRCKPGITGLWQISGRSGVTFQDRLDMDIKYHNDFSLFMDMEILFKTFSAVLKRDGAA